MKMKKRNLVLLSAATVLSVSLWSGATLQAAGSSFADLGNIAGKEKIEALKEKGFIKGVSADQFLPQQEMTAAQGVQLISNAMGLSLAAIDFTSGPYAKDTFDHVEDGKWYTDAFLATYYNGIEIPVEIDPNKELTREEFTHYLTQAMEKQGHLPMIKIIPQKITDEADINPSYQGSIQRSLVWGINTLNGEGGFDPKQSITRADAAVMTYNAVSFLQSRDGSTTGK
ncbi:S-layer homology domain-containing protein [Paenibacillus sp. P96]|uniref:S-layer homology domain-containing protein n=1 Tax=Paenibacillus zeirhizosphaerae TaxID=2987519 RepID=A0ABT9FUJ5_9BACL|nr:S-layer homology domain-containing protein [Paenibacillus sp. P96]MDP4098370.1 S-layer homology domain-containing protein [Paenibacillus sp. P96]